MRGRDFEDVGLVCIGVGLDVGLGDWEEVLGVVDAERIVWIWCTWERMGEEEIEVVFVGEVGEGLVPLDEFPAIFVFVSNNKFPLAPN